MPFPNSLHCKLLGLQRPKSAQIRIIILVASWLLQPAIHARAQLTLPAPATASPPAAKTPDATSPPAAKVHVTPLARDEEIQNRLQRIFEVTGLFSNPQVQVHDGVVFLEGQTKHDSDKAWAGDLARNTQDVVAVVNHLDVVEPLAWDFRPAVSSLEDMQRGVMRALPFLACAAIIMLLAYTAALVATRWTRRALETKVQAPLLREVFARCAGFLVLVIGLYTTLRIADLTHLALTIVGGTGLLGLVIGIAFGNITENFLASIFLSTQHPFYVGDLVEIAGISGYVQRLTTRATVVMTLDGNEVQIPNSTVYKSVIHNYSTSATRREDFTFSIPRTQSVDKIQEKAMEVLKHHPAVLSDPEPAVLVDALTDSTVVLKVYFWLNGREQSCLKVRSSVMRLVLGTVEAAKGKDAQSSGHDPLPQRKTRSEPPASTPAIVTKAEGNLTTDAKQIAEQAQEARHDDGENLLNLPQNTSQNSPQHAEPVR